MNQNSYSTKISSLMVFRNKTGPPILLTLLIKLFHFRVPLYKTEKREREEMPLGKLKPTLYPALIFMKMGYSPHYREN